jgi:diacylglycerol kinase family enzyme
MTRVPVLINPHGGAAAADPGIRDTVAAALEQAGVPAEIELIDGGDTEARCSAIASEGAELVIVGGGDGTIRAAASALVGTATRLAILPLGTLNHFARDLGIPADIRAAAALITEGDTRRVDVAELNGRIFINNSAIGLYPLMVLDRDQQREELGRSKKLAMIIASARTLARFGHQRLILCVNDQKERIDKPLLFVGNNDYRIDLGAAGQRKSLDDGRLCVMVMRKKTRRGFVAASIRALLNRSRDNDMERLADVEHLRVSSRRSALAVSMDGEVEHLAPPLDYRIRPKALNVIAP